MTVAIDRIVVGVRYRRELGDLSGLVRSIRELGLLHPIVVTPDLRLVAGARRLAAVRELGWAEVPVTVVESLDEALPLLLAERDENVERKELLPTEKVALGRRLRDFEKAEATERQREAGRLVGSGQEAHGKFPQASLGAVRDKLGEATGTTGRTLVKADAVVTAAEESPERFGPLAAEMDRTGRVDGVFRKLQVQRQADAIGAEPPPLPTGPFRVIVVDPPWAYENRPGDPSHRAGSPYPDMTLDEIKALPVRALAADDAILWLWTTNAHLRAAFDVVEAWGFTHKTILTWAKPHMGTGDWLRGRTEHCIMAVRGRPVVTLTNQSTLLEGPLREHSRKPDSFYALVESLCPGSKVELFAREAREGWVAHGSEVGHFEPAR